MLFIGTEFSILYTSVYPGGKEGREEGGGGGGEGREAAGSQMAATRCNVSSKLFDFAHVCAQFRAHLNGHN